MLPSPCGWLWDWAVKLAEIINSRRSVRSFLPKEVPESLIRELLDCSARAPSGGNLQPWKVYVVAGEERERISAEALKAFAALGKEPQKPEYNIYPPDIKPEYDARRRKVGYDMYQLLGIDKDDSRGKLAQSARNFEFFGAPVGMFFTVDRQMDKCQWADVGMYMQNLMLLARERGLDTCSQEIWAILPRTVGECLDLPEHEMLFCGMALGYADVEHPTAALRTEREELSEYASFRGF